MGEYCYIIPSNIKYLHNDTRIGNNEYLNMRGKRIVINLDCNDKINLSIVKQISKMDIVVLPINPEKTILYRPQTKLLTTCNKLPKPNINDYKTMSRFTVIPFETEFVNNPKSQNQIKMNENISETFQQNKKALMWLLINKYYPIYIKEGLKEPSKVDICSGNYREKCLNMEF